MVLFEKHIWYDNNIQKKESTMMIDEILAYNKKFVE